MNNQQWHYSKSSYYILLNKTAFIDVTRAESTHCDTSESTRRRRRRKTSRRRRRRRSWAHSWCPTPALCRATQRRLDSQTCGHRCDYSLKKCVLQRFSEKEKKKQKQQILFELCIIKSPVVAFLTLRCAKAKDLKLFKIQKKWNHQWSH